MPEGKGLTIGQTLDLLSPEFPQLTTSKLRYLDREGLVKPVRTNGRFRLYYPPDIKRLRFVLTRQRDQHLPLSVIKTQLSQTSPALGETLASVDLESFAESSPVPINRTALRLQSGLHPHRLAAVINAGLISSLPGHPHLFDPGTVQIAQLAGRLLELGWEPRHLKVVLHAADRHADLINQRIGPLLRKKKGRSGQAETRQLLEECVETLSQMHQTLLRFQARHLSDPSQT